MSSHKRIISRSRPTDASENEFKALSDLIPHPPSRPPLNTIQVPNRNPTEIFDETANNGGGGGGSRPNTPKSGRGKAPSESGSAQSTPARVVSRVYNGGSAIRRPPPYFRGGTGSKAQREVGIANCGASVEVSHFELNEDPLFWRDHNVQVLIRIRPINSTESSLQEHSRCLKQECSQTLMWIGHPETRFTFDHVACETISQEKLFEVAGLPMVENCMSGYNSCMFAYGQTGSGKTYTMMGEIQEINEISEGRGMTPRIFEYLFSRIREEEENRKDEKLKYSCKCSFLEIYNEQITDLLEPSSTNLQLREDLKKGVYVENLMEHEVATVKDVLEILIRGTANRKIAATHMNSESSRSHSVFTCVIESQWEKDSMTHLRYGRLNLVDLAGSERQKSSGAEGERLKEAANINKSLSTLGLVIMTLVDVAHGKQRHIPYRDSRLTFLLQDSLGGNSKTTIIANVSPSICSANETLSTLKFAQRAKLIQNNAKVNEDASGNVIALQQQIQQLKGQLTLLVNHQNIAMSPSCQFPMFELARMCSFQRENDSTYGSDLDDSHSSFLNQKIKNLEAILIGALRREKKMETSVRRLEDEIEHTNHLVCQREDDAQRIKDLSWIHEEKTKQLKMLTDGLVSGDSFLKEENDVLLQEIQLLQARINGNPELTRLSLENMRLNEELKMFQEFYQLGERETLLAEISELRQQLLDLYDGKYGLHKLSSRIATRDDIKADQTKDIAEQVDDTQKELDVCKKSLDACLEANVKLNREIDDLRLQLRKLLDHEGSASCMESVSSYRDDTDSKVDIESEATNSDHEVAFPIKQDMLVHLRSDQERDEMVHLQLIKTQKELKDAQAIIKYLEVQQVHLSGENNFMQDNYHPMELQSGEDFDDNYSERHRRTFSIFHLDAEQNLECGDITGSALYAHLEKMQKDLDEARMLNKQCWYDYTTQLPFPNGTRDILEQKEKEAVKTVHCSQEMSVSLSQQDEIRSPSSLPRKLHLMFEEVQKRLCLITEENVELKSAVATKEAEISALAEKWEKATIDLTSFLSDGCQSLEEASDQIEIIIKSFPQMALIDEHIKRVVQVFIGNEKIIADLQNKLENAQKMGCEMKKQLSALKEATLVFSDVQQLENDENTKELLQLRALLREKGSIICDLESKLKCKEDQNVETNTKALEDMMLQTEMNIRRVLNSENSTFGTNEDAKNYLSFLKSDLLENLSNVTESGVGLVDYVHRVTTKSVELNEQNRKFSSEAVGPPLFKSHELNKCDDQPTVMQLIRDELAETSGRFDTLKNRLDNLLSPHGKFSEGNQYLHPKRDSEIVLQDHEMKDSRQTLNNSNPNEALVQCLRNELESSVNRLMKMHLKLGMLVDGEEIALNTWAPGSSFHESVVAETTEASSSNQLFMSIDQVHQKFEPRIEEADADCCNSTEILSCQLSNARFVTEEKMKHADRLLLKFEEAQETMKEADVVLTTLLDVNMRAKHNRDVWKRASEVLEAEKASLLEVVQSLQITILQQEKESEILQDDIHAGTVEVLDSMVSLERSFLQIQMNVEKEMKAMHSEITSLGKDFLNCVGALKILLEDIASNMMEKGFVLFVLHLCHMGLDRMISSSDSNFCKYAQDVSHMLPSDMHKFCMNGGNIQKSNRVNEADEKIQTGNHVDQLTKIKLCSGENMAHSIQTIGNSSAVSVEYLERYDLCSDGNLSMQQTNIMMNSLSLKRELARKDVLLKGLLFDFRLLQELTSNAKDKKDETLGMMDALSQVHQELDHKTSQVDDILVQQRQLRIQLTDKEAEFNMIKSDLERANSKIDMLADENNELRHLLEDLYVTKRDLNENLEEKQTVIEGLEKEILCLSSSVEEKLFSTVEGIEDEMRKVSHEKDNLRDELVSLNANLDMAKTLADENEAIAVEARQVAETSKLYAEQKEEEVKILEHSIEELEYTIDVLEKKVHEMGNKVKKHQLMRRDLELELQTLQQRMAMIESTEDVVVEHSQDGERGQMHERCINLDQAKQCIKDLKIEKAKLAEEIKQYKDHIFELVLHSEAQASQFQQKYKALEAMVSEVNTDPSTSNPAISTMDKTEKSSMRTRGSSSPFKCIASLVQQMTSEKDQELSVARCQIEELEAVSASRQKEVCALTARLATVESMTHDVIRDLLGVKMDMTNYANLIDHQQLQRALAQQATEETNAKENENLKLKKKIEELTEERERLKKEISKNKASILATQVKVEQLQQRDQLLTAQNEMLKMDKVNLNRKIADMDVMAQKPSTSRSNQSQVHQPMKYKVGTTMRQSENHLSHEKEEIAWNFRTSDKAPFVRFSQGKRLHETLHEAEDEDALR